jgi:P4 family phage/plasmid primase-like protien
MPKSYPSTTEMSSRLDISGRTADALRLWGHIFERQRGYLCIAHKGPDGHFGENFYRYPEAAAAAVEEAMRLSDAGHDVWFCAHLLWRTRRVKGNAASVQTLWAEVDNPEARWEGPQATAVAESSPGKFHLYWRLTDEITPEEAEVLNRRLVGTVGADPSGSDLTQLLRVPGTGNHKYPDRPVVSLRDIREVTYVPAELEHELPELPVAPVKEVGEIDPEEPPIRLPGWAMEVWRGERVKRKSDGEVDRSATLWDLGGILYRHGASRRAVVEALTERDKALGFDAYPDRPQEYERIAAKLEGNAGPSRASEPAGAEDLGPGPEPNGASEAGKTPPAKPGPAEPGMTKTLADAITDGEHFAQDAGGALYHFSGGVYKRYAERYIRRRVKELAEAWGETAKWSSHRANEVVEYIRADAPILWERPPMEEINVLNGILNVHTRELRPHDPGFLSPVQLPVSYDPAATCPEWDKFISEVFPEDAQTLAYELPADLMTPNRSEQKAILLLGEGSNGKSTYLRAVEAFVGSSNTSGVSLHKLEQDRFSTSRLMGKLANICPDLPSTHLTETSVFKAITGGDSVAGEYKYREAFEFLPYCRLVFSANHVPRSGDASHAFFRRWSVVPFDRTFESSEAIPREVLDKKLSDPGELSGLLNKALEVLPRLRREGFTESDSMRRAWAEFKEMTDPVSVWLAKNTVEDAEAFVPKATLLAAYNEHCQEQGRAGMTKTAFGLAIKRARPDLTEAQRTVAGKPKTWVWQGIGLRLPGGDDPDSESGSYESNESS